MGGESLVDRSRGRQAPGLSGILAGTLRGIVTAAHRKVGGAMSYLPYASSIAAV